MNRITCNLCGRFRRSGFTLIEMLVTVSIISLLVSVLLPSLRSARSAAKQVVCSSNLRQIGIGLWNYWTENDGRLPYIISPMTNGTGMTPLGPTTGFGNPTAQSVELDPFDRERWPNSLANVLMPDYLGKDERVFVCPSAKTGWPHNGERFRYTYRPASANQPNGVVMPEGSYFRENFGFMDFRMLKTLRITLTGDPIADAQLLARKRSTFLRDLVVRTPTFQGAHRGGINVLDRGLAVEFRSQEQIAIDLGGYGSGVAF